MARSVGENDSVAGSLRNDRGAATNSSLSVPESRAKDGPVCIPDVKETITGSGSVRGQSVRRTFTVHFETSEAIVVTGSENVHFPGWAAKARARHLVL